MNKSISVTLSLLCLALSVRCGREFRFDNPVEQCLQGCNTLDASGVVPPLDASTLPPVPDAGSEIAGLQLETAAKVASETSVMSLQYLAVGIDVEDEPFVMVGSFVASGENSSRVEHWALARSHGTWSTSTLPFFDMEATARTMSGGAPAAFLGGVPSIYVTEPELVFVERPASDWLAFRIVARTDGCSLATAGVVNAVETATERIY
ncbi:MAG: hypothetical protein QM765_52550 [Myxococcales bacterium]